MKTLVLMLALAAAPSPSPDFISAVLTLTGALSPEELDESELERWTRLSEHPLDINAAPRSRLLSCGLFSAWQVASLAEARDRGGDILSATELSLVDGFDPETAAALSHFVVFRTPDAPGRRQWSRVGGEVLLRGGARNAAEGLRMPWGVKAELDFGTSASIFWGTRTTYSSPSLTPGTAHLCLTPRRLPARLVLGDFSARFGQGLAVWSGFSMSGFSSVQSFRKNGSGIGASTSFTRSLHGAAAYVEIGNWMLSAAYSYPSTGILNATRYGKVATLGTTASADWLTGRIAASADWRVGSPSLASFGEVALTSDGGAIAPAALAGVVWVPRYGHKYSVLARWYPAAFSPLLCGAVRSSTKARDEAGAALGLQLPGLSATLDWAYHPSRGTSQQKLVAQCSHPFAAGPVTVTPSLRVALRHKDSGAAPMRTDVRGDLSLALGRAGLDARANVLWCSGFAWLWNAGPAWRGERFQASARFTLFKVDSWDDRIYCYEPDAPGNFSIPAYYGRGYAVSALAGWKGMLFLKMSVLEYPWTVPAKPGTLEAKVQCRLRF